MKLRALGGRELELRTLCKAKTLKRLFCLWKDLKTRETTGHRALGGRKKRKALREFKTTGPQFTSLLLYPHSAETADEKVMEDLFLKQWYSWHTKQKQTKNFSEEMLPQPKYHGIFTEKNISPANNEFTIKKSQSPWVNNPTCSSLHIQETSISTPRSSKYRERNKEIIKEIHIKWLKTRKEAIRS